MNDNQVHCPMLLAVQQSHSQMASKLESNLEKRNIIKEARTQSPYISLYQATTFLMLPTDKDHDKYQHDIVITYSDETIIKHPYLNIDDVALAFNQ